jgi:steroid 5-alpha reductase family enzyme
VGINHYGAPLSLHQQSMIAHTAFAMMLVATACFLTGQLSGNFSQVDKLWSLLPILYTGYFAVQSHGQPRLVLMTFLVTAWGVRLTYNFARKGAYSWKFWSGEEDYRWAELRKDRVLGKPWVWMMFNLLFICLYQNALILGFTLPALAASESGGPLNVADYLLAAAFLLFLAIEWLADEQHWRFHREKKRRLQEGLPLQGDYANGFLASGLWSRVRHPNYAAEQALWVVFYGFSVSATGRWINWSIAGCLLLVLLFQGSSNFSERISSGKYPGYAEYQKKVPRFVPRLW